MRRLAGKGIALTVLAILAMSGPAAAFTPVPIPTPRTASTAPVHIAHDRANAISRLEE
jgi:hypothetical protein